VDLARRDPQRGDRCPNVPHHRRLAAIERAIELDDLPNPARRARLLAIKAL
jgi:hypothetical protein